MGLLLSGCSVEAASSFNGQGLVGAEQRRAERLDEEELRHLVEMSDLIVVGKLKEAKTLVDPEKMSEEIASANLNKTLPKPQSYVKGMVYTLSVSSVIFSDQTKRLTQSVQVYSLGDPYSLHSELIHLLPGEEYLIFLSRASQEKIAQGIKVSNPTDITKTDRVSRRYLYVVAGGSNGVRQIKSGDKLIRLVKKLADLRGNKE